MNKLIQEVVANRGGKLTIAHEGRCASITVEVPCGCEDHNRHTITSRMVWEYLTDETYGALLDRICDFALHKLDTHKD